MFNHIYLIYCVFFLKLSFAIDINMCNNDIADLPPVWARNLFSIIEIKFDNFEKRFDSINKKIDKLEEKVNKLDKKIDKLEFA